MFGVSYSSPLGNLFWLICLSSFLSLIYILILSSPFVMLFFDTFLNATNIKYLSSVRHCIKLYVYFI